MRESRNEMRIKLVCKYIDTNLNKTISLEELAKQVYMSPFHFHRLFRTHTGESVFAYIQRQRLNRAADKLVHTDIPISRIALDSAYSTPSSFTKAFKKRFDTSPSRFRQQRQTYA